VRREPRRAVAVAAKELADLGDRYGAGIESNAAAFTASPQLGMTSGPQRLSVGCSGESACLE